MFYYKQILDFHCPSKNLCHTSNLWNFSKSLVPTVYYRAHWARITRLVIMYFDLQSPSFPEFLLERELWGTWNKTQRSKARAVTLIGILAFLNEGEGRNSCFVLLWKLKMACCMYGFSRDAQLQVNVNPSCWHKAFVLYMKWWKSPMAIHGETLARTRVLERCRMPLPGR